MGLEMVSRVRRYQGQCRGLQPLGHQGHSGYRFKKKISLATVCSGFESAVPAQTSETSSRCRGG